nr:hypothetical protein [Tanacetum cinerariifolium]
MNTKEHERRHRSRRLRSPRPSVFSRIRRGWSRSPRQNFREKEGGVFKRLGNRERSVSARLDSHSHRSYSSQDRTVGYANLVSYFNSTLTGNARKYIKDPIELHNIKQRDGESTKDFVGRYKLESRDVKGAPECTRISGFVHEITNPELIRRLHDKIPKTINEIMRVTISFLRGKWQPRIMRGRSHEEIEGPMIIVAEIGGHCIYRMYVDGGSATEILYEHCFNRVHQEIKNQLVPAITPLIGFSGGMLVLLECSMLLGPDGSLSVTKPMVEERIKVTLNPEHPKQTVMNGSTLTEEGRNRLCNLPQRNLDIFAWKPANMTGVPRHIMKHRLNVREGCSRLDKRSEGKRLIESRNLEVYVDDLVIKSRIEDEIVRDIEETFKTLREINMKLNPKKCTFGIEEEIFLGYKFSTRVLKVCPDKKKCTKKSDFHWTAEAEEAIKQMKQLIAELPMLVTQMEKEELIVYLAATKETILADFILERLEEDSPDTLMTEEDELPKPWILFTDESSSTDGSGAGLILTNPKGVEFTYALRFSFGVTNNKAEYEALVAGLKVWPLTSIFKAFSIKQVPRSENKKADELSKIASTSFAHLSKQVLVEELKEKSISTMEVLAIVVEEEDTWMTIIFKYLTDGALSTEIKKARAVRRRSWRFAIINETLYKKSFLRPRLRCVGPLQANYALRETHEGSCSIHAGPGKVKFLIVAIDYFTKWIEEKPVATITVSQIKKFVWDNIVCRFGLPGEIISDNGKQFRDDPFKDWFEKLSLEINLYLLEEKREEATIREAKSKAKMEKYYNSKVRNTSFKPGDLVYRNNDASQAEDTGKLGPKLEGPCEVTKALGKGAYKLRDRDGKQLPCTWNISNLKKCYVHKM